MHYLILMLFCLPSCLMLDFTFKQSVYNVTVDTIETKWWSPTVYKSFHAEARSLRRGAISLEICFETKVVVNKFTASGKAFKRINGNYVATSISVTADIGDGCSKNYFGLKKTCDAAKLKFPLQPALYCVKDLTFDSSRFPPFFPGGSYKLETLIFKDDTKVVDMNWYGSVIYPKLYSGVQ